MARDLLERVSFLKKSSMVPYYPHELWNGSGYPEGLKGKDNPIEARVFALLDTWDALILDRPYRYAWNHKLVIEYTKDNSGIP